jgi:hypothetical protein
MVALPAQSTAPADHQHPRAMPGSVDTAALVDDAVTAAKIATDAVTADAIAADAVGTSEIAANAVGASELADNAVDTGAIADNAVTNAKMADNSVGSAEIIANSVTFDDVSTSFPRGIIRQQVLDTSNGAHSADATTDFSLTNVSVVAGRTYAIHLHSRCLIGSLDVNSRWLVRLRLNGSNLDLFEDVEPRVGGNTRRMIDATCYWTAPTTQATDDFDVFADEQAGDSAITFEASSVSLRTFTITDVGVIPP